MNSRVGHYLMPQITKYANLIGKVLCCDKSLKYQIIGLTISYTGDPNNVLRVNGYTLITPTRGMWFSRREIRKLFIGESIYGGWEVEDATDQ